MKTYAIHIAPDHVAENPFDQWGYMPPAVHVNAGRHYGYSREYGLDLTPPDLTPDQLVKHAPTMLAHMREPASDYSDNEALYDAFTDHLRHGTATLEDRFKLLAELHSAAGSPALLGRTENGYILYVATPEWQALTGISPEHIARALDSCHSTFQAWLEGECYGWGIAPYDPDTRYDGTTPGDTPYRYADCLPDSADPYDSCWGYYGSDHAKSGLFDAAEAAIAYQTRQDAKEAEEAAHWAARGVMTV